MSCYLSSSLFRNMSIEEFIKKCGDLSNKFVEMSAPHPYQTDKEISLSLRNIKKLVIILLFIIIFLHQKKIFCSQYSFE